MTRVPPWLSLLVVVALAMGWIGFASKAPADTVGTRPQMRSEGPGALRADAPPADGLGPIGQLGGSALAVAVRDGRAYLGVGRRLVLVDLAPGGSGAMLPSLERGQSPALEDAIRSVALLGSVAWLAAGPSGLVSVAASEPEAPRILGRLPSDWASYDVAIDADARRAYVAEGSRGMHIVDVADPASPLLLARADMAGEARAVAVAGDRAYVAGWGVGITIFDVSDPTRPAMLGSWSTDEAADVAVSGERLLVADRARGLLVFDVADPAAPHLIGETRIEGTAERLALEPDGQRAWLAAREGGLQLIDLATPAQPQVSDVLRTTTIAWDVALDLPTGPAGPSPNPSAGVVRGYVADVGAYTPAQPGIGDGGWEAAHIWGVEAQAPLARGFSGLRIVERDAGGSLREAALHLSPGFVESVARLGETGLLLLADGYAGLVLADAAPGAGRLRGSHPTAGAAHAAIAGGPGVLVADGPAGVAAFELSADDASVPKRYELRERWRVDSPGEALGLVEYAGALYVADGTEGLRVIDPTARREIGSVSTPGYAWDVAVEHGLLWLSARQGGLRLLSTADPAKPEEVGAVLTEGAVVFQTVFSQDGSVAWVAAGPSGLVALDASEPARPREIGRLVGAGTVVGLALDEGRERAYVAAGSGGLWSVDIGDPTSPRLERAWALPGVAERVLLHEGVAYVATERGGLQLVRVRAAPSPIERARIALPRLLR